MMWRNGTILVLVCLAFSSGCFCSGICTKRANEKCCPTDIRKTHYWCFGEDAVFHCPCGPKEELYGYERTDWREWPPDECCNGNCNVFAAPTLTDQPEQLPAQTSSQAPASTTTDPFRNDLPAAEPTRPSPARPGMTMPRGGIGPKSQQPGLIEPREDIGRTKPGAVVSPPNVAPRDIRQEPSINGPLQVMPPNRPVTVPELPPKRTNQIQIRRPLLEEELSPEESERRRQAFSQMRPNCS